MSSDYVIPVRCNALPLHNISLEKRGERFRTEPLTASAFASRIQQLELPQEELFFFNSSPYTMKLIARKQQFLIRSYDQKKNIYCETFTLCNQPSDIGRLHA